MSLRNSEMQIALPRTQDAKKATGATKSKKPACSRPVANSFQKESDIKRSQVQENSDSEKLHLKKESSEQHQSTIRK